MDVTVQGAVDVCQFQCLDRVVNVPVPIRQERSIAQKCCSSRVPKEHCRRPCCVATTNACGSAQLLTSIHKSQLVHGASPRDFVPLLQTCKAIYKVVTNVMMGIFFQVENVPTDSREALFPPQAHGSKVGLIQKKFGVMAQFRKAAGHMIQASTEYI